MSIVWFFGACVTHSGPITWNHLRSRCGTANTAAPRVAIPHSDTVDLDELNNFPLGGFEATQNEIEVIPIPNENTDLDEMEFPIAVDETINFEEADFGADENIEIIFEAVNEPAAAPVEILPIHPIDPLPQPALEKPAPNQHHRDDLLICIAICFLCKRW